MKNWRKQLFKTATILSGRKMFRYLSFLQKMEYASADDYKHIQHQKLNKLLIHAYKQVPYYRKILSEAGVVKNGRIAIENLCQLPILTKEIIRSEGEDLYSKDFKQRKWFKNTSGGSTGEPVEFLQDLDYQDWSFACRFLYNKMAGKDVGQSEIKLWGSERDVFEGSEKILTRLRRRLFNTDVINAFMMSEERMADYVDLWNHRKPVMVWSYASSMYEFARFVREGGFQVHPPNAIICTAETLHEDVRVFIEDVFKCVVLNQYGSREVGLMACECREKSGLHVFSLHNIIEILDENLQPCTPGQMGSVYVTNLNNYTMPLIRYAIGDTAVAAEQTHCSCGRNWPLIKAVTGRQTDHFKTRDGKLIHGEYFTHLFYNHSHVKQFQVIQHDYEKIEVKLVYRNSPPSMFEQEIINKVRHVLGQQTEIVFNCLDEIPPLNSGKYRYTISKL